MARWAVLGVVLSTVAVPVPPAGAAAVDDTVVAAAGDFLVVPVLANDDAAADDYVAVPPDDPVFMTFGDQDVYVDLSGVSAPATLTTTYERHAAGGDLVDTATLRILVVGPEAQLTPGDGRVTVTWPDRPLPVSDLRISYGTRFVSSHDDPDAIATVTLPASSAVVTGLDNGTTYYFYVTPRAGTSELENGSTGSTRPRGSNAAPHAVDDEVSFVGTDPVDIYPTLNDTDADADPLTIASHTPLVPAAAGTLTCAVDLCTFDPAAGAPDASFDYTVSDGNGGTATATVHLLSRHVVAVADAPASFPADEDFVYDVLANDTGVRADDYVDVDVTGVYAYQRDDGRIVFHATTAGTRTGTYAIYSANDLLLATGNLTLTVGPRRAFATFDDDAATDIGVEVVAPVALNDRIPADGFPVRTGAADTAITAPPAHGTATLEFEPQDYDGTGVLRNLPVVRYRPDAHFHGTDALTYTMTDAQGRSSSSVVSLDVSPQGASFVAGDAGIGEATVTWGLSTSPAIDRLRLCYDVATTRNGSATAPTLPCAHEWPITGVPLTTTVSGLTNDRQYAVALFVHYDDGTPDGVWSPGEEDVFRPGVGNVSGVWAEAGSTTATLTWQNPPGSTGTTIGWSTSGSPSEPGTGPGWTAAPQGATERTITGLTPGTAYHFSVFATATDSWGDPRTGDLTTRATNAAPVATADAYTVDQDSSGRFEVLTNDTDADGDPLTIRATTSASHGDVSCGATVCFYDPVPSYSGTDSFTYTVSDGHFGTATATVTVTVRGVPHPPVADDFSRTVTQGVDTAIELSNHASDPDPGDTLTYAVVTPPTRGTLTCEAATGRCHYLGTSPGQDAFTYKVTDSTARSATGVATLTVVANQPPVTSPAEVSATTGTPLGIDLTSYATDADQDALTFAKASDPVKGTATCTAAGACIYTGATGQTGDDSFTYTVTDGKSAPVTGSVLVHLQRVNHAPVARDASVTTVNTADLDVDLTALVTDEDHDALTYVLDSQPSSGRVSCAAGHCTYTPASGFSGTTSFRYHADDGALVSGVATVTITVTAVNRAPDVVGDSATVRTASPVRVDVAANDSDPDGDALSFAKATDPAHGTATCTAAGSCTYTSTGGFVGADSFTYTADDGHEHVVTGTVSLTVVANRAPTVGADAATTRTATAVTVDVAANDSDPDGDALSFAKATDPAHGSASCTAAGSCTYTSAAGYTGTDSFTYTAADGHGASTAGTVTITVSAAPAPSPSPNRAPTAGNDATTVASGGSATVNVAANDADPDGDALSFARATDPAHGTVACTSAGSCVYASSAGYVGPDSFTYRVADGRGATATGTVAVTVTPRTITIAGKPTVRGSARVGRTLTAVAGTPTAGTTVSYQWFAGRKAVKRATRARLRLTAAQRGKVMSVRITYTLPGAPPVVRRLVRKGKVA